MLIYGVKISDIKKYNDQKAERFFEMMLFAIIKMKTRANGIQTDALQRLKNS